MPAPTTFRKAHPGQLIVRLDLTPEQLQRAARYLTQVADARRATGDTEAAVVLAHLAERIRQAQ